MKTLTSWSMALGFLIAFGALPTQAQDVQTASDYVRAFKERPSASKVAYVLSGRVGSATRSERATLADSLEAIALRSPASLDLDLAREAIWALATAGMRSNATPFEESGMRLRRILVSAADPNVRYSAFSAYLSVPGSEQDFELVRALVTAPGPSAALALSALRERATEGYVLYRPEMRAVLRRVIEAGGFQSPLAIASAKAIAEENGWRIGGGGE